MPKHCSVNWCKNALFVLAVGAVETLFRFRADRRFNFPVGSGIVVNCVSPGPTNTAYIVDRLADRPELRQEMERYVPPGRFGKTEEVAEAVVFLATSEGVAIQGHDLLVDGGWVTH